MHLSLYLELAMMSSLNLGKRADFTMYMFTDLTFLFSVSRKQLQLLFYILALS